MGGLTRYLGFVPSLLTSGPLIYGKGKICSQGVVINNLFLFMIACGGSDCEIQFVRCYQILKPYSNLICFMVILL